MPLLYTRPVKRAAKFILYATVPVALWLQFTHGNLLWLFVFACLAVLPPAAAIGVRSEQLATRMGPTYGALLSASSGNSAELIIAIFAIRAGLLDVVRASFAGSIPGNLLFVAGLSMLLGGIGKETVKFNALAA